MVLTERVLSALKSPPPRLMQERPVFKGSQSTMGGKWGSGGVVERDEYGRPVVWHEDRQSLRAVDVDGEKEERRRRVESFVKSSNMSLVRVGLGDQAETMFLTLLRVGSLLSLHHH